MFSPPSELYHRFFICTARYCVFSPGGVLRALSANHLSLGSASIFRHDEDEVQLVSADQVQASMCSSLPCWLEALETSSRFPEPRAPVPAYLPWSGTKRHSGIPRQNFGSKDCHPLVGGPHSAMN